MPLVLDTGYQNLSPTKGSCSSAEIEIFHENQANIEPVNGLSFYHQNISYNATDIAV